VNYEIFVYAIGFVIGRLLWKMLLGKKVI